MNKPSSQREICKNGIESFSKLWRSEPDWPFLTVLQIMEQGIRALRESIESDEELAVNWETPVVELHYEVDEAFPFKAIEVDDPQIIGELLLRVQNLFVLQALTRNAAIAIKDDNLEYVLTNSVREKLSRLEPERRDTALQLHFSPFRLYGDEIDSPLDRGFTEFRKKFSSFPRIEYRFGPVAVSVETAIYPRIYDIGKEAVYYAAHVGLTFEGGEPAEWDDKVRYGLWEGLLERIREEGCKRLLRDTSPLVPVDVGPPTRTFPIPFGPARIDRRSADLLRDFDQVRFVSRRKTKLPRLDDLKAREVERLLDDASNSAFDEGLLKKRMSPTGKTEVVLTSDGERLLKIRAGPAGYIVRDVFGKEYLQRCFEVGSGILEVGISRFGRADPFDVADGGYRDNTTQADSLSHARLFLDARQIMEAVLAQLSRQGRNPVVIDAEVFRVMLEIENDKNWKARVESALKGLQTCSFRVDSSNMTKIKGEGVFLGEWWYRGAGPGAHGDGEYELFILPGFIGCLRLFHRETTKLSGREITIFDFGQKLTLEKKKGLRPGYTRIDAGNVFYAHADGLNPSQRGLVAFLEREITLKRDPASKEMREHKVMSTALDANHPRLYDQGFCPMLPAGQLYQGALGHFRSRSECGRTLCGTRSGRAGILTEMGEVLLPGRAHRRRMKIIHQALQDIKAVVVDLLEGVVAGLFRAEWISLEDASKLTETEVGREVRWFLFLSEDWRETRKKRWEAYQKERAERGETPAAWKVTEDPKEANRAQYFESDDTPLRHRLRAARLDRGLSQADLGAELGVSQVTVSKWERGPGRTGCPIPRRWRPRIVAWIEIPGSEPL